MKVTAVVLAAGSGTRMQRRENKVLLDLGGHPVIWHSVVPFLRCPKVNQVILVCKKEEETQFRGIFDGEDILYVTGGKTRQESVANAVAAVGSCDYIAIHDGARPFVTQNLILKTLDDAVQFGAAAAGVFVKDTIKVVDGERNVLSTPDRSRLISVHTPQIFSFSLYRSACDFAKERGLQATDDCALVEAFGHKVKITPGDYENIKITTPGDLVLGEAILKMRSEEQ